MTRTRLTLGAAIAAASLTAGCGGLPFGTSSTEQTPAAVQTVVVTATAPAPAAPAATATASSVEATSAAPTPAETATQTPAASATAGGTASGATTGSASAPAGGSTSITAPGSTLRLGQPAVVEYGAGLDKIEAVIEVKPSKLEKGALEDFEGYKLDAAAKASTPYYVTVEYRNVGKTTLKYPYLNVKLKAANADGDEVNKTIISGLSECPSNRASAWGPGDDTSECAVFFVPGNGQLSTVSYQGNYDDKPVTWKLN